MEHLLTAEALIAFCTLVALELVLGIDNVIFISILAGKLPPEQRDKARKLGIALAVITRVLLLFSLAWIMRLTTPWVTLLGFEFTGRDCILLAGGLFLVWKSTHEIHHKLEGAEAASGTVQAATFGSVLVQILILDIVFSLDSIITAVGMVSQLPIMIAAVLVSAGVMVLAAKTISEFVDRHPTIKMLALSFLLLIGFTLILDACHQHVPKGYIYFAMGFSVFVEVLNLRLRKKSAEPVQLHR